MISYAFIIILEIATEDSTVDCIEVCTQKKEFIRLTVEFDVTKFCLSECLFSLSQFILASDWSAKN